MSNAKPVSLFPMSFEQAIGALIKARPEPQKKRRANKRTRIKPKQSGQQKIR